VNDEAINIELTNVNCQRVWWASCDTTLHGPFAAKGDSRERALEHLKETILAHGIKWPKVPRPMVTTSGG